LKSVIKKHNYYYYRTSSIIINSQIPSFIFQFLLMHLILIISYLWPWILIWLLKVWIIAWRETI